MADGVELGVVVQFKSFSCSGVIIDGKNGLVLTVGSIANGLASDNAFEFEKNNFIDAVKLDKTHNKVQVVLRKTCKNSKLNVSKDNFVTLHGSITALWRDHSLHGLQKKIFPEGEWTFESGKMDEKEKNENGSNSNENHKPYFGLADFALIEVKDLAKYRVGKLYVSDVKARIGDPVSIVGTPFGSECYPLFFNSLSKGIVSNTIGSSNQMILTDARCVPGSEGCPVFANLSQQNHFQSSVTYPSLNTGMVPYGVVLAPFCWRSGEWIGLTLVCSISHILENFLESNILPPNYPSTLAVRDLLSSISNPRKAPTSTSLESNPSASKVVSSASKLGPKEAPFSDSLESNLYSREIETSNKNHESNILHRAMKSVFLFQAGATWGSGIVMDTDKGLVITCRHILTEGGVLDSQHSHKKSFVPLVIHDAYLQKVYRNVDIVFATDVDCPLDFALLRVENNSFSTAMNLGKQCHNSITLSKGSGKDCPSILTYDKYVRSSDTLTKEVHVRYSNILMEDLLESDINFPNDASVDSTNILVKGTDIFAIGYSIFGYHSKNLPCITTGVISNISLVNGSPVILQTSAAVHCGGSGGAIISKHSGQLVGMVTCNVKDGNSSTSFPHVNFSIPVNVIHKLVDLSMCDGDTKRDEELSKLVAGSERVWCLDTKQPVKSKL